MQVISVLLFKLSLQLLLLLLLLLPGTRFMVMWSITALYKLGGDLQNGREVLAKRTSF